MIGIEIDKQDQFREQSVPILSQIEGQEIETAHRSGRVPMFPMFLSLRVRCSALSASRKKL